MQVANENLFMDDSVREASKHSTVLFIASYLPHYLKIDSAKFHYSLSDILDDKKNDLVEIIGFRESAKSTYATLAFPLRVALMGEYKFIVIINDTTEQVTLTMENIKQELEHNQFIAKDFSHIKVGFTWSKYNLVLTNGVRIIGRSRGQNIRGIRHREHRPDLIIVDDPENLKQTKSKENRDATYNWFNAEVVPAKNSFGAKLIVIGNLLHNDGFIARVSKNPLFMVIKLPCLDENGVPLWLSMYPNQYAIDRKKMEVGVTSWSREYMLKVVAEEDQEINENDIHKYPNGILDKVDGYGKAMVRIQDAGVGVDLAISTKSTADYTAMVGGYRVHWGTSETGTGTQKPNEYIFIKPNPVCKRLDFYATQKEALDFKKAMPYGTKFFVEDVGYQKAALQTLRAANIPVFPMRPVTDKLARLKAVSPYIKNGFVRFPETGCEELINQIINFGVEQHDDLVDALVYLIMGIVNRPKAEFVDNPVGF